MLGDQGTGGVKALRTIDPRFAELLGGFERAATVHARLARIPDPEPDDFEPQDGPDYDDPDDLLS